jgi:hypothetical protein
MCLKTQLTLVLFIVETCFDTNGSSSGYHSVTLKKKAFFVSVPEHFPLGGRREDCA